MSNPSGPNLTRGITPGLPTNTGSFKATERADSGAVLDARPVWPQDDAERAAYADWQYEVANGDTAVAFRDWYDNRADLDETYQADSVEECATAGLHLTSVDEDGYCNHCGNQESPAPTPALIMSVQPEYWDDDQACPAGPEIEFDFGPALAKMDPADRDRLLADMESGRYDHDGIYDIAVEHGLVQGGFGPFSVRAPLGSEIGEYREALAEAERTPYEAAEINIDQAAAEAGLPVMGDVYRALLISDMGEDFERRLASLDAEEVYDHYERHIGPAIDAMENGLLADYGPPNESSLTTFSDTDVVKAIGNLRKTSPLMAGLLEVVADRGNVNNGAFMDKTPYRTGEDYETYVRGHLTALGEELQRPNGDHR